VGELERSPAPLRVRIRIVRPYLRVTTGARAGDVIPLEGPVVRVGRQPGCEIRFDPERDLDVSAMHAELRVRDDGWWIRDLGSRNGTWVGGERVEGEKLLAPGQVISFGAEGPRAEFRDAGTDAVLPTVSAQAPSIPGGAVGPPGGGAGSSRTAESPTADPSSAPVHRRISPLGYLGAVLLGVAVASALFVLRAPPSPDEALLAERERLARQVDSLLAEGDRAAEALQGEMAGLEAALRASQSDVRRIREELDRRVRERPPERGPDREAEALRQQLLAATAALRRQQLAASLDFRAIEEANRGSVALVYVESGSGRVSTGTAFAVRPDGTLVTSLHILEGPDGDEVPRRIGVQFSDSDQVWPARVLASSAESTLAIIKVDNIAGQVPTIRQLNPRPDTLANGSPLVLIGYPLGGDPSGVPGSGARVARPLVTAGVLSLNSPDFMEIQGHGDEGASGSPIFDATGAVVAILFGGRASEVQPVLLAVPSFEAAQLLSRIGSTSR